MNARMEYTQDRLRAEIRRLEDQIDNMQHEQHKQKGEAIVAETVLAVICLIIGFAVGAWLG